MQTSGRSSRENAASYSVVIPAQAGIQYAAAYRLNHCCLWILDPPPARRMTGEYEAAFSRHVLPEACLKLPAISNRRRREDRVRAAPAVSCAVAHSKRFTRAYRFGGSIPAFPAQWLYGLLRTLPGERLFCLRRPQAALATFGLDASTTAPEPRDFAVRVSHARLSWHPRPSHLAARQ